MGWHARRDSRKIHKWGSIIIAIPFLIVLISGLLLQVKKEFSWIQPPTQEGVSKDLEITFDDIISISSTVEEAGIKSWDDVDRLDVRPDIGLVKVRGVEGWEIQIDTKSGDILQVEYRRTDIIEALHDGSWFHDSVKLWIFLPSAIIVTVLWITGMYLFFVPIISKRKNKKRKDELKSKHE